MDRTMKRLILLALMTFNCTLVSADTLTLKAGHPESYVVKKGDTLWDISATFLNDPWKWPRLWDVNPQIANPHLIYPGDQLTLVFIDGQPRLVRNGANEGKPHIRKTPEGRVIAKSNAVPAVDLALIQNYLVQNRVVDADWFAQQPMVLAGESPSRHHVVGDVIYIDSELPLNQKLGMYERGRDFFNKQTGEALGQEAILASTGQVIESGKVSKVKILSNYRETKAGFRVLPMEDEALMSAYFTPKPAELKTPATVLAIESTMREAGKLNVVYLDKGTQDGVEPGEVFSIYRDGEEIVINNDGQPVPAAERTAYDNVVASLSSDRAIKMPDIYHGKLLVFKVFDKASLGLIVSTERSVRVDDKLIAPDSLAFRGE
ncbi:LysM peptidoglycan-binding domain-containing protein [Shewanella seohaensis]|uniref:LysM peptidoglycan-binding domain-containing protein n=1 Tax=Shewanella seohaensis TaxID=755175 RepID=UPI00200F595C|nr:LysM domain-containing protein [Shewanella seohaensis]MCL1122611.1 LysM peptidoglycan-binding domain-containing protein [Shewanella seohaensis]UXM82520.1 LysM peptidoglycan-binding domain-containing protein [Shewanella seohaensis]